MASALKSLLSEQKAFRTNTPQTLPTPGRSDEVVNNAGGYVFKVSDKSRLERFLILGTDGGTYYVGEQTLTQNNIDFVRSLIVYDEALVLSTLLDVADNNRAPKNTPSIFTLAMLLVHGANKAAARAAVSRIARTGTHLFELMGFLDDLGGWGRAKRSAVAGWYTDKTPEQLAYQVIKYRSRMGWNHRDVFRKVHPVGVNPAIGNFILGRETEGIDLLDAFKRVQSAKSVKEVIGVLSEHKDLPWETVPTEFLNDPQVWKTIFYNGALGQTALIRNIMRFANNGAFNDMVFAGDVAKALVDSERIAKGRIHPVAYANALGVYRGGATAARREFSTRNPHKVNAKVAAALETGFYKSFKNVVPANKATMVSIDVSGSMTWGAPAGLVGLSYLEAAAIMAMVTVRTEPYVMVNAFSTIMKDVDISSKDSLDAVVKKFSALRMGGTDVALPMVHATKTRLEVDTFVSYTDNETWSGGIKPAQALVNYRKAMGRPARLAVVALAGTYYTVADPRDRGQMDFVGFDSAAPSVLADFSAGRF